MKTVAELRSEIIRHMISFLVVQPAIRRPQRIPNEGDLTDDVLLRDLKMEYRDNRQLGIWLTRRQLCRQLEVKVTTPWKTVSDVVASVIQHGYPQEGTTLHRNLNGVYTAPDIGVAGQIDAVRRMYPGANLIPPKPDEK